MKNYLYRLLSVLLCLILLFCGWRLISYLRSSRQNQETYEALAAMVETHPATASDSAAQPETAATEIPESVTEGGPGILPEYAPLLERNPHLVAWIEIEGTVIDYPVVQTPDRPEYYLYRNFDGAYSDWGCLFADAACNVENGDNVTVYGHHMNDGSMFATLVDYEDRSYWEAHPKIRFDTLTEHRTYEIFAVIRTTATVDEGFPYHRFTDAETESEFDMFVADCKALSLYDTGIIPEYGDKLICLSTCEYTRDNGRFVVAAVYHPQ